MFQGCTRPAEAWGGLVQASSGPRGPWPKLSVWHGTSDTTMAPVNPNEIIKQWTNVHGLGAEPSAVETIDGYPRQVWRGPTGEAVIESYTITSMAHGTPMSTRGDALGSRGPFLLDVGISSSYHIARFSGPDQRGGGWRQSGPIVRRERAQRGVLAWAQSFERRLGPWAS